MHKRIPWIIVCSLLLYRWLLTLAPGEFTAEYAEPALQVFCQCCRDAYREHGTRGVLCLWLPTLTDALHAILAEHGTTLKQVFYPCLLWPVALALSCVLFPFSWLSNAWIPFGHLFRLIFATSQAYTIGHVALFCAAGLILLLSMPALCKRVQLYILCLMLGAFAEEIIQMLFNAHPGLHKDGRNLFLDLGGIVLASLLLHVWQNWRFFNKNTRGAS